MLGNVHIELTANEFLIIRGLIREANRVVNQTGDIAANLSMSTPDQVAVRTLNRKLNDYYGNFLKLAEQKPLNH